MRVLVCGGRNFDDYALLTKTLDALHSKKEITLLIHGAATGADTLAARWALDHCVPYLSHPANWKEFGSKAGPLRNRDMLTKWRPALVVAFPGGPGTSDMVKKAKAFGVDVKHAVLEGATKG